jgi:alanyl-tRNA synthetase
MAEEKKLQVDVEGFNSAMEAARERSRTAQNKVGILFASVSLLRAKIPSAF